MGATPSYDLEYDDDGIVKLGKQTFDGFTSGHALTLVAFVAPWCGHCKRFKSHFALVAEKFKDEPNIAFARVDCVAQEKLYEKFKIVGFPTVKLFRHGVYSDTYDFARKVHTVQTVFTVINWTPVQLKTARNDANSCALNCARPNSSQQSHLHYRPMP